MFIAAFCRFPLLLESANVSNGHVGWIHLGAGHRLRGRGDRRESAGEVACAAGGRRRGRRRVSAAGGAARSERIGGARLTGCVARRCWTRGVVLLRTLTRGADDCGGCRYAPALAAERRPSERGRALTGRRYAGACSAAGAGTPAPAAVHRSSARGEAGSRAGPWVRGKEGGGLVLTGRRHGLVEVRRRTRAGSWWAGVGGLSGTATGGSHSCHSCRGSINHSRSCQWVEAG